jgi:pyridoxal phosphate enzyme (YggS family)
MNYEAKFDEVLEKMEIARLETNEHQIVKIVAISKYVDAKAIEGLYKVGQRAFGENKVQALKQKSKALEKYPLEWHFVGRLQTNKINALLDLNPSLIHSIDSYEKAVELDKRAKVKGKTPNILLQINSAKEESKAGVMPEVAIEEYLKIKELKNLKLKGIMTIGAHTEDEEEIKKSFETTYSIYEKLQNEGATICSMGMSGDFELAIKCGSNMLRLGSVLFK